MKEDNKEESFLRLISRNEIKKRNIILYKLANEYGVNNYTMFNDYGYRGLYNENVNEIKLRKGLNYKQNILDYMNSEELFSNLFRIIQTASVLRRGVPSNWNYACQTHFQVGIKIRKLITDLGSELPERIEVPSKSIMEIEKEIVLI